jgi:ferrous iron transport protein B
MSMWERGWSFIKKAGTIILLATIFVWATSSFGWDENGFGMVAMDNSILAKIGSAIAWLFIPLGWGNWQSAVAAITGLIAKENVVGTFGILFGVGEVAENGHEVWANMATHFTSIAAYSFLVFNLLCAPCFAAMGAIKREMNSAKWFWIAIGYQCGIAYLASLVMYNIANWIGFGVFGGWTIISFAIIVAFIYALFRKPREVKA